MMFLNIPELAIYVFKWLPRVQSYEYGILQPALSCEGPKHMEDHLWITSSPLPCNTPSTIVQI